MRGMMRCLTRAAFVSALLAGAAASPAADRDPEALAAETCAMCHGADGFTDTPGVPRLAGQHAGYLADALSAYTDGRRDSPMMEGFVKDLSAAELAGLAAFYAARPSRAAAYRGVGDPMNGRVLARSCTGCHGADGNSISASNPRLAGQDAEYLVRALRAYADGRRVSGVMRALARPLNDAQLRDLAAFFAGQSPR
jgi:cytochrome c553